MRDVSMNERAKWSAAAAAASGVRKPTKPKRRERPAAVRITRTSVTSEALEPNDSKCCRSRFSSQCFGRFLMQRRDDSASTMGAALRRE